MKSASPEIREVIDTNIFVSGLIARQGIPYGLLEHWRYGTLTLLLSSNQEAEIRAVLVRPHMAARYGVSQTDREELAALLVRSTTQVRTATQLPLAIRDAKDEMILAAALGGRADYLETGEAYLLILAGDIKLGPLKIVTQENFSIYSPTA